MNKINYNIKGMVCSRCLKVLKNEMEVIGVKVNVLQLGFVQLEFDIDSIKQFQVEKIIENNDFEVIKNRDRILAEQTKIWIIKYVWESDFSKELPLFLSEGLGKSYQVLSRNFSKIFGQTIERYSIKLKVERVKESIHNGEKNFSEIAYSLGYQNPSALSRQFKKETGLSMRNYQKLGRNERLPIDELI
mgnify:CR=1 FL=1